MDGLLTIPERRMGVKPCACGGRIRADRFAPAQYVAAHNRSKQHQRWWWSEAVLAAWHPWDRP